jgi:hypothetical protein
MWTGTALPAVRTTPPSTAAAQPAERTDVTSTGTV